MLAIKNRITRVGSTKQITKAMQMVYTAKVQRAKAQLQSSRPFAEATLHAMHATLLACGAQNSHLYLRPRPAPNALYILLSGDRGMCGGYNINAAKKAIACMEENRPGFFLVVGRKGSEFLKRKAVDVRETFVGISDSPFYEEARDVGEKALALYQSGEVDEIHLIYTKYQSIIQHIPTAVKLLPLELSAFEGLEQEPAGSGELIPGEEQLLSHMVPQYVYTRIFGGMVESFACEQSAGVTSMDEAVKNSSELIDSLNLQYNRARQGAITQELTEIVGGFNALG